MMRLWMICLLLVGGSFLCSAQEWVQEATALAKEGNYEAEIDWYLKKAKIFRAEGDTEKAVLCDLFRGHAHVHLSQFERALPIYKKYLPEGAEQQQSISVQAEALDGMGFYYSNMGEYPQALKYLKQSLTLRQQLLDTKRGELRLADVYNMMGLMYHRLQQQEQGMDYYERSLRIRQKYSTHADEALRSEAINGLFNSYSNIGMAFEKRAELLTALKWLKKAEQVAEQYNEWIAARELATLKSNCGRVLAQMGKLEKALEKHQASLALRKEIFGELNPKTAKAYNDIGWAYGKLKQLDKQLYYYEKSLYIKQQTLGAKHPSVFIGLFNLGGIHQKRKNYEKALGYFQKSLAALVWEFNDSLNLKSNPDVRASSISAPGYLMYALERKSMMQELIFKQDKQRLDMLKQAYQTRLVLLDLIEQLRYRNHSKKDQKMLSERAFPSFQAAMHIGSILKKKDDAAVSNSELFELVERSKAFTLLQGLSGLEAQQLGILPEELQYLEDSLKQKISSTEQALFALDGDAVEQEQAELEQLLFESKEAYRALLQRFEQEYPKYHQLRYQVGLSSLEDIQQHLAPNQAFVEYFWGKAELFVILIEADNSQIFPVTHSDSLNELTKNYRSHLSDYSLLSTKPEQVRKRYIKEASQLYEAILAPVLEKLTDENRLVIVPDGPLSQIPFETLLTDRAAAQEAKHYADMPFLLKDYAIQYSYSGSLWEAVRKLDLAPNNGKCLAFAPNYGEGGFEGTLRELNEALPGAQEEVNHLQEHFEGDFHRGKAANRRLFEQEAAQYSLIHLAMHGIMDEKNPLYSKLAFSPSDTSQSPFLHAFEIQQMQLSADLVVLSACETGAGEYQRGEGVMSLARSFLMAGTPSVLMTLWKINDQASAMLMGHFYEQLADGQDIDLALQQAKLNYLESTREMQQDYYGHPSYWAAFVGVGDERSLGSQRKSSWPSAWWLLALVPVLGVLGLILRRRN